MAKHLESQLNEANNRIDEANRIIAELNSSRNKLAQENADLTRQVEETEVRVTVVTKEKQTIIIQLEESRRTVEEETRVS